MLFGCKLSIGGVGGRNHVKRVVFCIFFYSDERQATCCNAMQDVRYSFHFVKTNGQPRVNLTFPFYAIVAFDVCLLATHISSLIRRLFFIASFSANSMISVKPL